MLNINEQVIHRRRIIQGARGTNEIRLGTILAFKDEGQTATVMFPANRSRADIPIHELESVRDRFHRAQVQVDPARRGIAW